MGRLILSGAGRATKPSVLPEGSETTTISFTVDGVSYQAEEGMTWAAFIASDYNTGDFTLETSDVKYVYNSEGAYIYLAGDDDLPVVNTNAIVSGGEYYSDSVTVDVGTTWLYEYGQDGTFEVPATGTYQVELHGGGGGGADITEYTGGGGGGGSGAMYEVELTRGDILDVVIGAGGEAGEYDSVNTNRGGTTVFGSLSLEGGGNGSSSGTGGTASGSLATNGTDGGSILTGSGSTGGYGNSSNTSQTYGNGGKGETHWLGNSDGTDDTSSPAADGEPGAVIITFMGVS